MFPQFTITNFLVISIQFRATSTIMKERLAVLGKKLPLAYGFRF